ncbi:hypothetical protein [Chryseobacterium artocarpi]|uniref:hypothetical protein n=1 Tax=Chryseobacterium artocarpi TaxID=1414727 RepID=UPI003F3B1AFC
MEENKPITREELKTYFETGKYPTQSQFSDLIDSLKHKKDRLTNKEAIIMANSIVSINNVYLGFYAFGIENQKFPILISSDDEDVQEIIIENTPRGEIKQYLFGNGPYTFRTKEFPAEGLGENEYYYLEIVSSDTISRMVRTFGNTLPTIPEGLEFVMSDDKWLNARISKMFAGQQLKTLKTNIEFVNKTKAPIQYKIDAGQWANPYTSKNIVTDHYDNYDILYMMFRADLRGTNQSIGCSVYDMDSNKLLKTINLEAGQNIQPIDGVEIKEIRNVRIECDYYRNEK